MCVFVCCCKNGYTAFPGAGRAQHLRAEEATPLTYLGHKGMYYTKVGGLRVEGSRAWVWGYR